MLIEIAEIMPIQNFLRVFQRKAPKEKLIFYLGTNRFSRETKLANEKTLELNITHEILQICRRYDPLAFTIGTTLVQESYLGYDSRTR